MNIYLQIFLVTIAGGLLSLLGGLLLLSSKRFSLTLSRLAVPFAAGALLGAAFFELIPEALHDANIDAISIWILVGLISFFLLEYFIHWFHHDHDHEDAHHKSTAILVIIGDTVHNFIDGIAIGAAFLISPATGVITAIAVASHEIPQEIGDFGLLLRYGFKCKKVIIINLLSALAASIGAILTFWFGSQSALPINELLAITAGLFIYIAASDLIPTIHKDTSGSRSKFNAAILLLGGLLIVYIATTIAHSYLDTSHDHVDTGQHSEIHAGEDHHDDEEHTDIENH